MKIRIYPDEILRKISEKAEVSEVQQLVPRLIAAMINYSGIGIAAPQVGIDKRIAVISQNADETLSEPLVLLNPRIIEAHGRQSIEEGCLSISGITAQVPRNEYVKVETGPDSSRSIIEASGLFAIVIQHEIDHLDGILFPDRLGFPRRSWALLKARRKKASGKR